MINVFFRNYIFKNSQFYQGINSKTIEPMHFNFIVLNKYIFYSLVVILISFISILIFSISVENRNVIFLFFILLNFILFIYIFYIFKKTILTNIKRLDSYQLGIPIIARYQKTKNIMYGRQIYIEAEHGDSVYKLTFTGPLPYDYFKKKNFVSGEVRVMLPHNLINVNSNFVCEYHAGIKSLVKKDPNHFFAGGEMLQLGKRWNV